MTIADHDHAEIEHRSGAWVAWRIARGLLAAVALVVVVAGVPWALLQYTHWPIAGIPTWEQISDFPVALVTQDSVIVGIFTLGLWTAWAVFSLCVVVEAIGEIRGTTAGRVPAAGPLQGLARTLVASVAMTFGSFGSLVAQSTTSTLASATAVTAPAATITPDATTPGGQPTETKSIRWQTVTVEHGDTAWELAERHYNDGTKWLLLWQDNRDKPQPDGRVWLHQADPLEPGWQLRVRIDSTTGMAPDAVGEIAGRTDPRAYDGGSPSAPIAGPEHTPESTAVPPGGRALITRSASSAEDTSVQAAASPPSAGGPEVQVTVQPGDNLWCLAANQAESVLGRPATDAEVGPYWRRVIDRNRNQLTHPDNPDLIYPDQTIILPPFDPPSPEAAQPAPPPAPRQTEAPPDPEETPPSTAPQPDRPTTTSAGPNIPPLPPPTSQLPPPPAPTTEPADPSTTTRPTTTTQPERHESTTAPAERSTPSSTDQPVASDGNDDDRSSATALIGVLTAASVGLAVGVTQAIRRRRRRRNHHHPTTAPRPSSNPQLHRELIAAADEDAHDQLRRALRHLATALEAAGTSSRPRMVQQGADHLDVLLDEPAQPVTRGWKTEADGAVWSCDPTQFDPQDDGEPTTAPLLVTLGQPDDAGQLYLDLEAAGVVTLIGDPAVAGGVARAMVTELAHSPLGEGTQIIVAGSLAYTSLARLDRVTAIGDWATAATNLQAWTDQSHEVLVANGWPNAFLARTQDRGREALVPLLVVTDEPPDDSDGLAALCAVQPRAAALVVVGDLSVDSTVINCTADRLSLPQLGLDCIPYTLGDKHLEAIAELLDDAEDPAGEQLQLLLDDEEADDDPNDGTGYRSTDDPGTTATAANGGAPYHDPPYDVLVRVLGDIRVEGDINTKPTPQQTAAIAYVALHRTVTLDRLCDALWNEPTPSRRRRAINTMSAARTAIGGEHLPLTGDASYRAGPRLLTDLDLLKRRLAAAARQPRELAIETLRGALELVEGPIFTYPSNVPAYAWVSVENWISTWELKIAALARELTGMYIDSGDPHQAVEVAQHAQHIAPADTGLTELLMQAHAATGDRVAVQRVYQQHLEALHQLDLDEPAESTIALYEQLRRANGA